jgi:hypothetical protein
LMNARLGVKFCSRFFRHGESPIFTSSMHSLLLPDLDATCLRLGTADRHFNRQ